MPQHLPYIDDPVSVPLWLFIGMVAGEVLKRAEQSPRRPATTQGFTMTPRTMEEIEQLTKVFAGARAELAERVNKLREEQEAIKRRLLQGIKNSIERAVTAHDELHAALQASPKLFEKPKTRILHMIRVGWFKQKGKLEIADEDACIAALRKMFGEEADAYIKTTEKPIKDALLGLPAKDLAKLGVKLSDDVDAVIIKPADDAIDKLVAALTGDVELESEAQRA
jgi:phage host-nuclease inhibitor protein Gam